MGLLPPPPALDRGATLFLDLDGTLVDIAPTPDAIDVDDGLRALLTRLSDRLDGRLAVISGRALDDLTRHLRLPDIAASGSHGLERRGPNGIDPAPEAGPAMTQARAEAVAFARQEGLVAETKPAGVAIHFRARPDAADAVAETLQTLARAHDLVVQPGAMVGELRLPGPDKGDVVRRFMGEAPFSHGRPVMVGDDLTDEAAFAAVEALGGTSVLVGPPRKTNARFGLPTVQAVRHWLETTE